MDAAERDLIGKQVAKARQAKGWSQATLAHKAQIAPNTVGSIEAGENVRPTSLGKVMAALNIEPQSEADWRAGLPADVHLAIEVLARILMETPERERPDVLLRLLHAAGQPNG